jgi:hypothetical protein
MDDVMIYLGVLRDDLNRLFSKYNNGEDVEELLNKLKPVIKNYYETQPE